MPPRDRTKRRALPTQERARASIDAILGAAALLLEEIGFARTTTNRIAARAGVNVGLVYRYFAGKEAIAGELIERAAADTYAAVDRALTVHATSPLPVAFRALLEAVTETPRTPALHRELVEHVDVTKRREVVHALHQRTEKRFARFLRTREDELRALRDPDATLFVLHHAIEAASHAATFYRPARLSRERALDALAEVLTRSLLPIDDARKAAPKLARKRA